MTEEKETLEKNLGSGVEEKDRREAELVRLKESIGSMTAQITAISAWPWSAETRATV